MSTPAPFPWPTSTSPHGFDQFQELTRVLWQKLKTFCSNLRWVEWSGLGLGIVGLILTFIAWGNLTTQVRQWSDKSLLDKTANSDIPLLQTPVATASAITSSQNPQTAVTVYITGAVKKPGVYHLSGTSLFMDAVMAAGGFSSSVWQDYLDQFVNLAQPLVDHQKIWIPKLDQQDLFLGVESDVLDSQVNINEVTTPLIPTPMPLSQTATTSTDTLISINSATTQQLMTLNGIGEKRAEDIVANRPYQSLSELTTKAKISASIYEQIAPQLKL